jgi:secreted trypsin-like serine protease
MTFSKKRFAFSLSMAAMCQAATITSYTGNTEPKQGVRRAASTKPKPVQAGKAFVDLLTANNGGDGEQSRDQPETKIIGGESADEEEYEYYVQLFYGTISLLCGGSLIAPNVVLTAAHCFVDELDHVSVGTYHLAENFGVENGDTEHATIVDVAIHPSYGSEDEGYDIMLLKLDESFYQFQLVTLNFDDSLPADGDFLTVIGLGLTNAEDASVAPVLQELTVQSVPTEDCFPHDSFLNDLVNGETEFCASSPGQVGGQDSCQGEWPAKGLNDQTHIVECLNE